MSLPLVSFMSRNCRTPCFLSCCCCNGNRIGVHGQNRGLPSNTSSRSATPCSYRFLHSGKQSTKLFLGRYLFRVYQLPFYTGRMSKSSSDETGSDAKGKKLTRVKEMYDSASSSVLSVTSDLQRKALGLRDQINMPTIKLPDVKLNNLKDAVRVSRLVNRKSAESSSPTYSKPRSEDSAKDMKTDHYSAAATVEEFIKVSKEMEGEKQLVTVDERTLKTLERSTRKPQDSMSRAKKDFVSKTSVYVRTRQLVRATRQAGSGMARLLRVEELTKHLISFPEARVVAVKENAIPVLLRYRDNPYQPLVEEVRETLSLLGYEDPVKGRGVRILSIDGGGTRGVVAVETLRQLEEMSGKSIYQMFDYISGVSSGAILAILLGVYKVSLDECEELYRRFSEEIFKRSTYVGVGKLFLSHAFYDTAAWEKMLKTEVGDRLMIETVRDPACPKISVVSTLANHPSLRAYLFRNYNLPAGAPSHYHGDCCTRVWEAVRASSAAPGYFEEFKLGQGIHQDGGVLVNNPCAVAIHESKLLWPDTPLQCVVSVGMGRYEPDNVTSSSSLNLRTKLSKVVESATNTEGQRFGTSLKMIGDGKMKVVKNQYKLRVAADVLTAEKGALQRVKDGNQYKLRVAADVLTAEKGALQRVKDSLKLKMDMYRDFYDIPLSLVKCLKNEHKLRVAADVLTAEKGTLQRVKDGVKLKMYRDFYRR
ncbi:calcium-independent phospholipase A2-gamma-like [Branchiostoma floridae]|uniref:Calcium-independent phospholipase A2-gamma-like n=1 Tax=Branchiostoma floridae TaxID=7739 RepID=A0A9J7L6K5_BRAFL|nr:calcium-independent phospholipase A2-gamma-like [Branchiostoma floridae]